MGFPVVRFPAGKNWTTPSPLDSGDYRVLLFRLVSVQKDIFDSRPAFFLFFISCSYNDF